MRCVCSPSSSLYHVLSLTWLFLLITCRFLKSERASPLPVGAVFAEFGKYASGPASREDRKSTRLNSSHVAISYAVFCLKKKKTINELMMKYRSLLCIV